jgi:hypothetical protein
MTMTITERIDSKLRKTSGQWTQNMATISEDLFEPENNVFWWSVGKDSINVTLRCLHSNFVLALEVWRSVYGIEDKPETIAELKAKLRPLLQGEHSPFARYMTSYLNAPATDKRKTQDTKDSKLVCVSCKMTKCKARVCNFDEAGMRYTYLEPKVVLRFKEI